MWATLREGVLTLCHLGHLCGFSVRREFPQLVWGNQSLLVETPHIWCQGKNPDSLLHHLGLRWDSGTGDYCIRNSALRNLYQFSAFSEFLAESGSLLNGLWQDIVLFWCHHLRAMCLGANYLQFPQLNGGEQITWVFWKALYSVPRLCLTLCNPMDHSLSSSSVHGIPRQEYSLPGKEWVAISLSIERIASHEYRVYTVMVHDVHFLPKCFSLTD